MRRCSQPSTVLSTAWALSVSPTGHWWPSSSACRRKLCDVRPRVLKNALWCSDTWTECPTASPPWRDGSPAQAARPAPAVSKASAGRKIRRKLCGHILCGHIFCGHIRQSIRFDCRERGPYSRFGIAIALLSGARRGSLPVCAHGARDRLGQTFRLVHRHQMPGIRDFCIRSLRHGLAQYLCGLGRAEHVLETLDDMHGHLYVAQTFG